MKTDLNKPPREATLKRYVGKKFGVYTIVSYAFTRKTMNFWNCVCQCGFQKTIGNTSVAENTKTCGKHQPKEETDLNSTYLQYKNDARRRGLEFKLSKEDIRKITRRSCSYCGVEPYVVPFGSRTKLPKNGIDRINSNKGYEISNCVPCCKICNFAKRDLSLNDFNEWVETLVDFTIKKKPCKYSNTTDPCDYPEFGDDND